MCPIAWDDADEAVEPLLGAVPIHVAAPGVDPVPLDYRRLNGVRFRPNHEVRLVTQGSIWLLARNHVRRLSQEERMMAQVAPIDGRIENDERWLRYQRACFQIDSGWLRVRILPAPEQASREEISTGRIIAIGGTWEQIEPTPTASMVADGGSDD